VHLYLEFKLKAKLMPKTIGGSKGQLISKCPFGVKTSSKKPTKFFPGFLLCFLIAV
jgi:hypothetical protein